MLENSDGRPFPSSDAPVLLRVLTQRLPRRFAPRNDSLFASGSYPTPLQIPICRVYDALSIPSSFTLATYSLILLEPSRREYSVCVCRWTKRGAGLSAAEAGEGNVAIHFLSTKGTAKFGHPYRYAGELNEKLMARQELNGWIVVDFASAPLAEHIYEANFR